MSDRRLQRLLQRGYRCGSCDQLHKGIFDIAFGWPEPWDGPREPEPHDELAGALAEGRDILTGDFCVMGEFRFIRAVMPFRLQDSEEEFWFGVWGSVSPGRFADWIHAFETDELTETAFSWLSNDLPGMPEISVKAQLVAQDDGTRPHLYISDEDHPLYAAQDDGLPFETLLDIYAAFGHDLRPAIADA